MKRPIAPFNPVPLFAPMREELLNVLASLSDADWTRPTACEGWTVRDVGLHILGDDLGLLSRSRDHDGIYFETDSWDQLVTSINEHNDRWIQASRRISRRLLLSLLDFTGKQVVEYFASLPLEEDGAKVDWAGTKPVPRWLQIGRELTEYWMHHQHICEAVDVMSLKSHQYLHPVLTIFVHALPRTYQHISAPAGTAVQFHATGEGGDTWYVICEDDGWSLYQDTDQQVDASVEIPADTTWRLFTKGVSAEQAKARTRITGDQTLGETLLNTVAIIA